MGSPVGALGASTTDVVGRRHERRRAQDLLTQAAGGRGAVLLIGGPSGIGKTYLARCFLAMAVQRGFGTLVGTSNPLNTGIAYAPLVEAVGRGLRGLDTAERDRVTRDLPALSVLFADAGRPGLRQLGDPALDRTRLFDSVVRLLDRLSRIRPLVFLIDDLQWFDRASLQVLAYLTRDLPALPVLLIGTLRPGEARPDLLLLLQSLRRAGLADEVTLSPLDPEELAELARRSLGGEPPLELIEHLVGRSGGVPLFAEALIEAWREHGVVNELKSGRWLVTGPFEVPPPPAVRHAILDRLGRLGPDERHLVDVLAVGGGDVAPDVVDEVAGIAGTADLLSGLSGESIKHDPVRGGYSLAHPLVLEVAYRELGPTERGRLHARYAEALERYAPDDVERLALHHRYAHPGDADRVLQTSAAAGERALARYANDEARDHFASALSIARIRQRGEVRRLLRRLGEAALRSGDLQAAVRAWDEAIAVHEDGGSVEQGVLVRQRMAEALVDWGDLDGALWHVQEGLASIADHTASELHCELLLCRFYAALQQADPDRAEAVADDVAQVAVRVGSRRARAIADFARGGALVMRGELASAAEILAPAQEAMVRAEPRYLVRQQGIAGMVAAFHGDLPALRDANRRTQAVARRVGIPPAENRLRLHWFVEHLYAGEWDLAEEVLQESEFVACTTGHPRISSIAPVMAVVLGALTGDIDGARGSLSQLGEDIAGRLVPRGHGEKLLAVLSGFLALEDDDPAAAVEAIAGARGHYLPELLPPWGWVVRGEAHARTGHPEIALTTADELEGLGPPESYPAAAAERLRGLAVLVWDPAEGVQRLGTASVAFERLGMPFEAARAHLERAESVVRVGIPVDGLDGAVVAVHRTTTALGAVRYAERAGRVLAALGTPVPVPTGQHELTPRQREVAGLVADGLSNAEIAERLYLSIRTVESHLDHIYTRLGINSRVALAAYVLRGDGT